MKESAEEAKESGTEEGGTGDGEDPGENDAAGDAPADSGEAAGGSDADDGAGDGVGSADGNAEDGVHDERDTACGFGCETTEGRELGDALAHSLDNAPAPRHGAAAHGQVTTDNDPVGNGEGLQQATSDERRGDNAHALLRIVRAVTEAEEGRREQLQAAEPAVNFQRTLAADHPAREDRQENGEKHANNRREEDESDWFDPSTKDQGLETRVNDGGATIPANQRMGGTGWEA